MKRLKKFFPFLLFLYVNAYAYNYGSLTKDLKQNINNIQARFSYLKPKIDNITKVQNNFQHLENKNQKVFFSKLEKEIENAKYVKGVFFNKEEFEKEKEFALKQMNIIKSIKTKGINFLFFLTSSSVPNDVIANWMLETAILQKAGVQILPIVYTRGFGKNFKKYFFNLANTMKKEIPKEYVPYVKKSFRFKLGPQFFKYFHLKRVPAIVLANCNNLSPMVQDCKIKYIMRGDMHLDYFFDKISQISPDPVYKKYYQILIANKIVNYNDKKNNISNKTRGTK